jgi:hypothetical protein
MKVKFWCDSGANIHSEKSEVVDLGEWGISEEEWATYTEDDKYKLAEEWAWNGGLGIGVEEVDG